MKVKNKSQAKVVAAVIGDLVQSRTHADRSEVQTKFADVLDAVNAKTQALEPLTPTVGDECQGIYANVQEAIEATLLVRLELPIEVDCRFGIGIGTVKTVGRGNYGAIQDGPAWWAARDAINEAKHRESRRNRKMRTWSAVGEGYEHQNLGVTNAYLLARDHIVSSMTARQRRILRGLLAGSTQAELAKSEGTSQSAISQLVRSSGAFDVIDGLELIRGDAST